VDKDINALHLKPSDAVDRSKWKGIGVRAIMTVMLGAECGLYITDAES